MSKFIPIWQSIDKKEELWIRTGYYEEPCLYAQKMGTNWQFFANQSPDKEIYTAATLGEAITKCERHFLKPKQLALL